MAFMWKVVNWILLIPLLIAVSYMFYNQTKFQSSYKSAIFSTFESECNVYSTAQPSGARNVNGNTICQERGAGDCIFTIKYGNINQALTGSIAADGSNLGIIESCQVNGVDSSTVAYCCRA